MTQEQIKLVREGRRQAHRLYTRNLDKVSSDEKTNNFILELAQTIDTLCDDLEGCSSEKSFLEHFTVLSGGECWWSKQEDDNDNE